jgi:putative redox protein
MADAPRKPPTVIEMTWQRDLVFGATSGHVGMTLDSASDAGPSPIQALAFALAGCMAMDVVHMLRKGRHDLRGLHARLSAERAPDVPHRFTSADLHLTVNGSVPREAIERAIALSRDKYCSVWHSMRHDIELAVSFSVVESA